MQKLEKQLKEKAKLALQYLYKSHKASTPERFPSRASVLPYTDTNLEDSLEIKNSRSVSPIPKLTRLNLIRDLSPTVKEIKETQLNTERLQREAITYRAEEKRSY